MSGYLPIPGSPDVVEGVAAALRDEAGRIDSAQSDLRASEPGPGGAALQGWRSRTGSPSCRPSWVPWPTGMPPPRPRFEQADRRCARALGALLDDMLADTWQYDTVKGAGALGHGVADTAGLVGLVPFCKTVSGAVGATAAGVALGADLTVKLAYGEGEWRPLVGDAVLRAVGFGAGSLRQASRARGLPSAAHEGPTGFGTGQERLAAGIRAHAKESNPWRLRGPSPGRELMVRHTSGGGLVDPGRPGAGGRCAEGCVGAR